VPDQWVGLESTSRGCDAEDGLPLIQQTGEGIMKTWKTPTFCETCVGAEINCYAANGAD